MSKDTEEGKAVDCPNFCGYDQDKHMVVYGHVQKVVHGEDSNNKPISLLVFRWHLQQRAPNYRFKSASIRVVFMDKSDDKSENITPFDDPHVRAVAPNGTYGMALTPNTITRTIALSDSLAVGDTEAKNTVGADYTLMSQVTATQQVVINGNARCLYSVEEIQTINRQNSNAKNSWIRGENRCNAAEWNLFENTAVKGGLPSMFHTVVLLERKPGNDDAKFQATFTIRTCTNGWMNKLTCWKRYGLISRSNPVIFNTATEWLEESSKDAAWATKLGNADLFKLCNFYLFHLVPTIEKDKKPDAPSKPVPDGGKTTHTVQKVVENSNVA